MVRLSNVQGRTLELTNGRMQQHVQQNSYVSAIIEKLQVGQIEAMLFESLVYPSDGSYIALDLGANVGLFSIFMEPLFDRIVGVEMHPEHCVTYRENVKELGLSSKLSVLEKAVWNASGVRIEIRENSLNTTNHTAAPHGDTAPVGAHGVDSIGVMDLVCSFDDIITFMKVDIEGAEYTAFDSVDKSIRNRVMNIWMEVHQTNPQHSLETHRDSMAQKLYSLGYNVSVHGRDGILALYA